MILKASNKRLAGHRVSSIASIVVLMILIVAIGNLSRQSEYLNCTNYNGSIRTDYAQYNLLADSLLRGEVSLDLEVSQDLANMSNPYSFVDRQKMIESNPDAFYYFDTAFYNSKYYCYFGIVPALMFYMPYKAITGCDLATTNLVIFLCCLFVFLSYLFIKTLLGNNRAVERLFPLILIAFVEASNILQLVFFPAFYCVPMILGIDLSLGGLLLWDKAAQHNNLNLKKLLLGSLLMAAVFGCRPQLGVGSLAAFLIFKDHLKQGKIFRAGDPLTAFAAIGPYLIVFIGLGVYNQMRFGNPLDFGSSYNLTGFDMTNYSQSWFLSISLVFSYLFEPIKLFSSFPFVDAYLPSFVDQNGQNWAPNEPIPCGYFWLYPVIIFAIMLIFAKLKNQDRHIYSIMIISAFVILVFDCRNAGISWRYFADFGWILSAASCWGFSKISNSSWTISNCCLRTVIGAMITVTLFITMLSLFSSSVTRFNIPISVGRPHLYSLVSQIFS